MILPKFIVRRSHGRQYIPDLDAVCLTEKFRGRPELTEPSDDEQRAALTRAAAVCPTQAIAAARLSMAGNGRHYISLDEAIQTMLETGRDMCNKYKETSTGGLAVCIVEC